MKEQSFIPVVTTDKRVLGTCAIQRVTFTGSETQVLVEGVQVSIKKFEYFRPSENDQVEFMGHEVTATEEREMTYQHLPGFSEISENTPTTFGWVTPPGLVLQPDRVKSQWETFSETGNFV